MHDMEFDATHPITTVVYKKPFDPETDIKIVMNTLKDWAQERSEERIFVIHDVLQFELTFSQMVQALAKAFGKEKLDPRIVNYVITDRPLLSMGVNAVSTQDQYGKVSVQSFTSRQEAMEAILQEVGG